MASSDKLDQAVEAITERLDLILRVLANQVGEHKSMTERARLLKMAGLDNQTIAEVLNTTPATVRTFTTNLRTPKKKKKRRS